MPRTTVPFFILSRQGSVWEYRFICPLCQKHNSIPLERSPDALSCLACYAPLDASNARVELSIADPDDPPTGSRPTT